MSIGSGRGFLHLIVVAAMAAGGRQVGRALFNGSAGLGNSSITISEFKEEALKRCDETPECDEDLLLTSIDQCWGTQDIATEKEAPALGECLGKKVVSQQFAELCDSDSKCIMEVRSNFDVCWDDSFEGGASLSDYQKKSFAYKMAKCMNEEAGEEYFVAKI